jgi:hypothetical protein
MCIFQGHNNYLFVHYKISIIPFKTNKPDPISRLASKNYPIFTISEKPRQGRLCDVAFNPRFILTREHIMFGDKLKRKRTEHDIAACSNSFIALYYHFSISLIYACTPNS